MPSAKATSPASTWSTRRNTAMMPKIAARRQPGADTAQQRSPASRPARLMSTAVTADIAMMPSAPRFITPARSLMMSPIVASRKGAAKDWDRLQPRPRTIGDHAATFAVFTQSSR